MEPETYVEDRKLDHIRLVCSSAHCTTTKPDINGKKHLVHKTICMEHYKFKSSVQQWFMNPDFADCEIMNEEGKCRNCGCAWTMHMATKWETIEKKKSTDKEVEDESEDEYEEEEEPIVEIKPNGDALIQIQNFNEPQTPKQLKRSQSQRNPNRLNKLNEPKREEKAKSEEKSIPKSTEQSKMIVVPVEVKEEPKVVENKKPVRSKTTNVDGNQLLRLYKPNEQIKKRPKTTGVSKESLPSKEDASSVQIKEEPKVFENKKPIRSKTAGVDPTQLPKSNVNSTEQIKQRPKTTEVSKENLPSSLPIKELKAKKEELEEEEEETVKPKYRTIKFKTTSVTNQDLEAKETLPTQKNDAKPPKFKTTAVDSALLQPNVSNEKSVEEQKEAKSPNETKSTRRSIRFKFFGADGKEEKSPKRESKSPPKSPSKSPTKSQKFDKWKTPNQQTSQKPPESPTKFKKSTKQKDDFDEISEVLQSRAEDYAPSTKLLRFSDIIHIVDKEEEKDHEEDNPANQHDDASTVYTNVDRNSVMELKFDKQPPRRQSNENNNSFRKMGRVLNRPEQYEKAEASVKAPIGKPTKSDQKPLKDSKDTPAKTTQPIKPKTKVTTVRFGQNDEPTIASSTITRTSIKKPAKLNAAKSNTNPSKQNGHLPTNNPTDEEFAEMHKELQCADDDSDEVIEMLDSQMDTRSERCRRWLIDNSIAPSARPEKFLQRLKKTIVRAGTRLKNVFGGGRSSGQETEAN